MRRALFVACLLACAGFGCVGGGSEPRTEGPRGGGATPPVAEQAPASVDSDLTRLRSLQLFEVGELVAAAPGETGSCYGIPCPGEEADAALARQAERLEAFVALAEAVHVDAYLVPVGPETAPANLDAIAALHIVEVGDLVVDQPRNSPECYNLPCAADQLQADAANTQRAAELAALAERSRGM